MDLLTVTQKLLKKLLKKITQKLLKKIFEKFSVLRWGNEDWRLYFLLYSIQNALTVFWDKPSTSQYHEINDKARLNF